MSKTDVEQTEDTKRLLNQYLRRLTNLSGNNRSLFLPRFSSDQFLDVQQASQFNREKSFSIIEALIAGRKKIICPVVDARLEESNIVSRKLRRLRRTADFVFEERGSQDLHLGWPFIRGKLMDGTSIRCPLLFFPVELIIENEHWVIRPRQDADITFNKTFLLAYSFFNKVTVSEELLDEDFEETDRDSTVFRTCLYQLLQKANVDIHFNADNYRDEINPFIHYAKDEFEKTYGNGELKLFPEAVIGIFPQSGSYLVPDYQDIIDNQRITDLGSFFASRSTTTASLGSHFMLQVKEEKMYTAFPMDVWQENAVKAVKVGNSVVVQGPPGTGKSQLICNLISDCISNGKTVMVVCQKRAALDVVYARLAEKRLSSFLGLVHDFRNDRKLLYDKIASQIDHLDEFKSRNNSLDAIQLERNFYQTSRRIDAITEELEEFRRALFDKQEAGVSVKELYLNSDPAAPAISLRQEYANIKMDALPDLLQRLQRYAHYAVQFENKHYPWRERKSFAEFQISDRTTLLGYLNEIPAYFHNIQRRIEEMSAATLSWEECELLVSRQKDLDHLLVLIDTDERYAMLQSLAQETDKDTSALWLSNIERIISDCFLGEGPEVTVPLHQLGQFQNALRSSMKTRSSLIGLIRWELFSQDKIFITRVLVANGLQSNKEGFLALEERLDNRLNLEHNFSKLREHKALLGMPEGYQLSTFQHWVQNQLRALQAKSLIPSIRGLKNIIDPRLTDVKEFKSRLQLVAELLVDLPLKKAIWQNYLTTSQINILTQNATPPEPWVENVKSDFDALVEFDRLKEGLKAEEKNLIDKVHDACESWEFSNLESMLTNSLSLAWIEHIERKYPQLAMVSSGKLKLMETELRDKINEKYALSDEILLLRARERITEQLEFNRLNNLITYRDLYHQVTKKKRIWPLRKLVSEMSDELFRVIPCWLVSPESASAIFPMREMFDLVIFDEASQCFAERGIPAMYRGRQVVVAGDNQQLRPNDLYQVRWQEEDNEHPDLEVDSLLELCSRYFITVDLRSHYRSRSLPLIDFSNQHFYRGRLQLLPDREAVNRSEPPIEYRHVDGIWEDQTNRAEAETVVALIEQWVTQRPEKTIGVVTFNSPQQNLILDLLEEKAEHGLGLPSDLFVKNIENVQGDERDIIIFSIGYAPDKTGKISLQFGSLSQAGGENRLNVAVSRAREKIFLVASLWPEALHVEDAAHRGPKLLRAYLEYARQVSNGLFTPFVAQEIRGLSQHLKRQILEKAKERYPQATLRENHFPFADLVVSVDTQYMGMILTDDEDYFNSLSVKDRHALLPELLDYKHWKFLSQFSRNHWLDQEKSVNEVGKFLG